MKKQQKKRLVTVLISVAVCIGIIIGVLLIDRAQGRSDLKVTEDEAAQIIGDTLSGLPLQVAQASMYMVEKTDIQVLSVEYGTEKDIRVHVSYKTPDAAGMYALHKADLFSEVWKYCEAREAEGKKVGATNILILLNRKVTAYLEAQPMKEGETDLYLYDTGKEQPEMYLDDQVLNTLLGGFVDVRKDIAGTEEITVDGQTVSIAAKNNIRNGIRDCFGLNNYDSDKPDTSTPLVRAWNGFKDDFYRNFIQDDQWTYLAVGLGNTLALTGASILLGILLGFLAAIIHTVHERTGKMKFLNGLVSIYVSVIRGTPVMIQLMIIYFVLLLPIGIEKFPAAVLCFGLNSGAYVSEIVRGGIQSVDVGQTEAGRSLGFGFGRTMFHIVMPQAFKASLPALCNEFISLLKETSVAFYIGVPDLTEGGLKIRSITFSNYMPLIAVALIYLVVVLILTRLVKILERRLRKSERM